MKRIQAGPPIPAIGNETPPDSARHGTLASIVAGILLAITVTCLAIASTRHTRLFVKADLIISDLFPKNQSRCCDANGNEWRAR